MSLNIKPVGLNADRPRLRIHATQEWFDIYQPETNDELQRFLDHYLLGKDNGWESTPLVRISLLRFNGNAIQARPEDNYPPTRTTYETLYLDAYRGALVSAAPATAASTSYHSDSWDDDGAHFKFTFNDYTELCGFSKAKIFLSCNDMDDADVYVIIRKLDRHGVALLHHNIPFRHQRSGTKIEDIPDENIYKYVGPNGRLRASKRTTAEEPGLSSAMRAKKDPTELWFPHSESKKVPKGQVVELNIAIWPGGMIFEAGETLRLEVKGHDPILPEYGPLYRNIPNLNVGKHWVHTGAVYQSSLTVPLLK